LPYKQISELPEPVKKLPEEAQRLWMATFNSTYSERGNESTAFKVAWSAVKKSWREEKGRWVRKPALTFAYHASIQPYQAEGKRYAKIFLLDDTVCSNNWGVTSEARRRALESIKGKPVLGPPERGHSANCVVGRYVGYQSNGVTWGIAEITDPEAWEKIRGGEWCAVSPQIDAYKIRSEGVVEVIEDFDFIHTAFVDQAAFSQGQSGVKATCEGIEDVCTFNLAFAAASQSHIRGDGSGGILLPGGEPRQSGEQTREEETLEEKKIEVKNAELEEQVKTLKAENISLKNKLAALEEEKHLGRVAEVVDLRIKAGLAEERDRGAEMEKIKTLPDPALNQMEVDLKKFSTQLSAAVGPKAKHTGEEVKSTYDRVREEMFGPKGE
jgi:cation transport regulator